MPSILRSVTRMPGKSALEIAERRRGVVVDTQLEAGKAEPLRDGLAHRRFVVDEQDRGRAQAWTAIAAGIAS